MSAFVIAAIAMLVAVIPCGIVMLRGKIMEAVVAYEAIGSVIIIVLVLLGTGTPNADPDRSGRID